MGRNEFDDEHVPPLDKTPTGQTKEAKRKAKKKKVCTTPTQIYNMYQDRAGFIVKKLVTASVVANFDAIVIIVPPPSTNDSEDTGDTYPDEEGGGGGTKKRKRPVDSAEQAKKNRMIPTMKPIVCQTSEGVMDRLLSYDRDYSYFYGRKKLVDRIGQSECSKIFDCLDGNGRCDVGDDGDGEDPNHQGEGRTSPPNVQQPHTPPIQKSNKKKKLDTQNKGDSHRNGFLESDSSDEGF